MEVTIQDLGSVAELVAAVATVATLVYLAMQIRQNTQALHRAAVHATVESGHSVRSEFIQSPEVASLYLKGLTDPHSLSQEEALRFGMLMLSMFENVREGFEQYQTGAIQEHAWEADRAWLESMLSHPGGRMAWKQYETSLGDLASEFGVSAADPPVG